MPYAKLLLAAALVVVACFALVLLLKSRRGAGPMLAQGLGPPPPKGSLDADRRGRGVDIKLGREVLELLETGRRAEAVALVRGRTGLGAGEAEAALDRLDNLRKRLES